MSDRTDLAAGAGRCTAGEVVSIDGCAHLPAPRSVAPGSRRCEACVTADLHWLSLRVCLECGEVACCDSSPGKHATAHHEASGHPTMTSGEPGELWQWCFVHEVTVEP